MGTQYRRLSQDHAEFISAQKIFFVGTATETGRVSVSPKGMDSLIILDSNRIAWLNVTGSGNETSAHIQSNPRMTLMFCAFEGKPLVLRVYGKATVYHGADPEWNELFKSFKPLPGARQIFEVVIDLVQSSCGMSVPFFDYAGEREMLNDWARAKGDDGIRRYWSEKNQVSIDGLSTNIGVKSGIGS